MANMSKFHFVFSSSTLIRLNNHAFNGHLCQTVNNFVKQNKSSHGDTTYSVGVEDTIIEVFTFKKTIISFLYIYFAKLWDDSLL